MKRIIFYSIFGAFAFWYAYTSYTYKKGIDDMPISMPSTYTPEPKP